MLNGTEWVGPGEGDRLIDFARHLSHSRLYALMKTYGEETKTNLKIRRDQDGAAYGFTDYDRRRIDVLEIVQ